MRSSKQLRYGAPFPILQKFQHAVFFVNDLEESQKFYEKIFDVQYSATNHPDSSAAMKIVGHTMKFFSFGYYHHDICFVQNPKVTVDNEQWSHFTLKLSKNVNMNEITRRLKDNNIHFNRGYFLPVPWENDSEVIHFTDPNGHIIEVIANGG